MASDVSICREALQRVGGKSITSLLDESTEAKACNLIWTDTRDSVFREHPWNCLIERAVLQELAQTPAFGFAHQFQLPADCIRVLESNDQTIPTIVINGELIYDASQTVFKIEGRKLLTDEVEAKIV